MGLISWEPILSTSKIVTLFGSLLVFKKHFIWKSPLTSILLWIPNVSSLFGEDTFYWPGWKHFKGVFVSHKVYGFAFFHTRWKDPLFLRKIEGQEEILIHVNPWQTPFLLLLMGCCAICIFFSCWVRFSDNWSLGFEIISVGLANVYTIPITSF